MKTYSNNTSSTSTGGAQRNIFPVSAWKSLRIITPALLVLLIAACTPPKQKGKDKVEVSDIRHIVIDGESEVALTQGDEAEISSQSLSDADFEMKGDTLYVYSTYEGLKVQVNTVESIVLLAEGELTTKGWIEGTNLSITLCSCGELDGNFRADDINVDVQADGEAEVKVDCNNLTVSATGTGDVTLKGNCVNYTKRQSGLAGIDSRDLSVENMKIE